jgi:hypothetical protein
MFDEYVVIQKIDRAFLIVACFEVLVKTFLANQVRSVFFSVDTSVCPQRKLKRPNI